MGFPTAHDAFAFYAEAINLHEFHPLQTRLMHPDICCRFDGVAYRGVAEVRRAFEGAWAQLPNEIYRMTDHSWLVEGEVAAIVSFKYTFVGTDRNGLDVVGGGTGLNVYARGYEGWLMHLEDLLTSKRHE